MQRSGARRPAAPRLRIALGTALGIALALAALLAAGPLRAQAWLPAAQAAAQGELADEFGYAGPVTLASPTVAPLSPTVAGLSGTYQATVAGTSWIAWGLLDDSGAPVVSALARTDDPVDAVPLVAGELAVFWKGDPSSLLFSALGQYLGAHASLPAAPLSVELRQSTIRAILDLHRAGPGRDIGFVDQLANPLATIFRQLDFPAALAARDVGRALAEWDLDDPRYAGAMAFDYSALYFALYVRGRDDAAVLPLLPELAATITAADRSLHPNFDVLLSLVAQHHLYLRPGITEPVVPGRDPMAAYRFVTAWRADHAPPVASTSVADVAYRLASYLDPGAAERAASLTLAREEATALVASAAQGSAGSSLTVVEMLTSTESSPDPRRFGNLDTSLRGPFLQNLVDGFDGLAGSPSAQDEIVRFLAWTLDIGAVPADRVAAVTAFLSGKLDGRVASLLADPLPAPTAFDSAYQDRVASTARIAKSIGRREALDPFLDRFLVAYPGSLNLPPESPAHFAARRTTVLDLWHRRGSLILDRASAMGRNDATLAALASLLDAEGPLASVAHHAIFLAQLDPDHPDSDHAGLTGWAWVQVDVSPNDTPSSVDQEGLYLLEALEHEIGHNVHRGGLTRPADVAIAQLYERSDLTPSPDDFLQTTLWQYGAGFYKEEAAESFTAFLDDAQGHLDRALALARAGKPLQLQKVLVWAGELARLRRDGDALVLYRRVVTPGVPGTSPVETRIDFRPVDRLRVLSRDAEDRIVRMSDSRATYSFTYSGWQLTGVTAGPPPGLDFYTVTPCRLVDTRPAAGVTGGAALAGGSRRDLVLTGACGIPADARSLSLNVTVTQPAASGFLTVFAADLATLSPVSTINFSRGQTRANNAVLALALDGSGKLALQVGSPGAVHLILDVNGYFR